MTALMSAAARAAHPLVDDAPHLWDDPVAVALCRALHPSPLDYQLARPDAAVLAAARLSTVTRSAFTQNRRRGSGLEQYVVLGAGLDTSAHHRHEGAWARTWLVDLPGVLAWRAGLFQQAGLGDVGTTVPSDLAAGHVIEDLTAAGLDRTRPAFVAWLGVSMYLEAAAVRAVLVDLARLAPGSRLVFDHILPAGLRDEAGATYAQGVAAATGAAGEPWRCTPGPDELTAWLDDAGWDVVEDVAEADAPEPGFWPRTDSLRRMRLVRLTHAVTRPA